MEALARWAVAKSKPSRTTRTDPHPIKDFFIADLIDYAPKDHPDMMERPFFSIAKRRRLKPIEYRNDDGSVFVRVTASPEHGMATDKTETRTGQRNRASPTSAALQVGAFIHAAARAHPTAIAWRRYRRRSP